MTAARSSYIKTIGLAIVGASAVGVIFALLSLLHLSFVLLTWALALAAIALLSVIVSGLVVLHRERRASEGRPDLFIELNKDRSESSLADLGDRPFRGRSLLQSLFPVYRFKVGDLVEIRSWEDIQKTLDAEGTLEGVPFMREMLPHCGRSARILRRVDKVYDYGRSKTLRRMDDAVLLVNLRCDGSAHGGCQARCSMIWKTAWLKSAIAKSVSSNVVASPASISALDASSPGAQKAMREQSQEPYTCQYTEIAPASAPMRTWDIRQDLRPLLAGNVSFAAFVVALLTWEFNWIQRLRGGIPFPQMSNSGQSKTPVVAKNIQANDTVSVLSMDEIGKTLDVNSRNRGLWFDREMIKHCRQPYRVLLSVNRIIDDATRKMVPMKTPCIVLNDAVASGEFLHFCSQQEYLFWREAWLQVERESA